MEPADLNIAVLGLGRMGHALAERLLTAGRTVSVWNRSPDRGKDLVAAGAHESSDLHATVAAADVVISSLTGDEAVSEVLLAGGAPLPAMQGVLVDCSTVGPRTSRALAQAYPQRFVAAPIAGAPQSVLSGQCLLLFAGAEAAKTVAGPVLATITDNRIDVGEDAGQAAVLKLLNNYLLMAGTALVAEVVATAQAAGFEDRFLRSLLTSLSTVPSAARARLDGLLGSEHPGWFTVDLASKDLQLAVESAEAVGSPLALAEPVRQRYEMTSGLGHGGDDITAVIEVLRRVR